MTSVVMKVFEYTFLDRIFPILQGNGHPALTQTAYRKHISCQDAIFATQEAIVHTLQEGRVAYLFLYDLEKAFDSIEHSLLLQSLYQASINGKAWRFIKVCYGNLTVEACLELLESFQAEIGRRIFKLSKFHSQLSVCIGLSWPSITSRILMQKLSFLCRLLTSDDDSITTRTFSTFSQNAYNLSLVKQCIFLDSKLKTNFTALILSDIGSTSASLKAMKKSISSIDQQLLLHVEEAGQHQSVCLAREVNWLRVWEATRDRDWFWTNISQSFFNLLTMSLFGDRRCRMCDDSIPEDTSFFTHLS